jgi:hypothetical protein
VNEGAAGDSVIVLEAPEDELAAHEWIEAGKPYREFLVPAEQLNRYPIAEVIADPRPA